VRPNWFVGLPVDGRGWLAKLLSTAPAGLRLFHPADLHLTVAFLGPCGQHAAERAFSLIAPQRAARCALTLQGLAALGNARRPSALSVLANDHGGRTVALIERLRGPLCCAAGARLDERPALAHITVARLPRRARPELRRRATAWTASRPPLGWPITLDRLVLYTWAEDRSERQFRRVAEHLLGARSSD